MWAVVGVVVWTVVIALFGTSMAVLMGLIANPFKVLGVWYSKSPKAADLYRGRRRYRAGTGQYRGFLV